MENGGFLLCHNKKFTWFPCKAFSYSYTLSSLAVNWQSIFHSLPFEFLGDNWASLHSSWKPCDFPPPPPQKKNSDCTPFPQRYNKNYWSPKTQGCIGVNRYHGWLSIRHLTRQNYVQYSDCRLFKLVIRDWNKCQFKSHYVVFFVNFWILFCFVLRQVLTHFLQLQYLTWLSNDVYFLLWSS